MKENINAPLHWPLWGEFTGDRMNSPHKGPVTWKMFPFDDVIMHLWSNVGRFPIAIQERVNLVDGCGRCCQDMFNRLIWCQAICKHCVDQRHLRQDDVIKWKHFPRYWPFVWGIHRSPVNSPHKGQWRGALMFSFICAWINCWVNSREAGDLRRHHAHFDVTVMNACDHSVVYIE